MKNTSLALRIFMLLVLLSTAASTLAAPKMLYTHNKIRFISGGISHEEVVEMRKYAKKYSLNLLFSEGSVGRAVSGHNVDIYNESDEQVFRLKNAQPVLYVNLPAGNYLVLANNNGVKLRHKFTIVENETQKIILNWKDAVEEDSQTDTE